MNEKVVLVGVYETGSHGKESIEDFMTSMEELAELTAACGMEALCFVTQQLDRVNTALYIGPGKVGEVKEQAQLHEADLVICNDTLSPSQLRNLQDSLDLAVMDRTALILEIFELRARTREAKLQVELARLKYLKPRLVGMRKALTRQGGTSGSMSSRGAGERKLELDRRRIDERISELSRELKEVEKERATQRKARQKARIPQVSLVGYTNAGKSTVMNAMVDRFSGNEEKKVFEADMLFATLDTTVRKIETGNNKDFLLSDTVGFIKKLPHSLVESFKSTLEEVKDADLLVQVVDYSDEHHKDHIQTTLQTLIELNAGHIPMLLVFNKCDLREETDAGTVEAKDYPRKVESFGSSNANIRAGLYLSAKDAASISFLVEEILAQVYGDYVIAEFLIPYDKGNLTSYLMEHAQIIEQDYRENGTYIKASCHLAEIGKFADYRI